ncbi:hypothetical protein IFM89_037677 [Coptis chinensis]|uniref:Uncharacterized protein n=1 Tax=Coptis chinensis TaxID=261450 RepID=A0A835IIC0_9MAGN|nr:hypothetical protein IFM89_037677 [Coptis chinensis]
MALTHDRRELGLKLTYGDLVPAMKDIKPTNIVLPPPNNRNPGRPKKQRIRGKDEEKSSGKRKCRRCGQNICKNGGILQEGVLEVLQLMLGEESDDSIVDLTREISDNSTEA